MGTKRQIKRNQVREKRKNAKKNLKDFEKTVSSMPTQCALCESKFNPKNDLQLDSWMVRVSEKGIAMFCERCYVDE